MWKILLNKKERSRLRRLHPYLRSSYLMNGHSANLPLSEFEAIFSGCDFTNGWFSYEAATRWLYALKEHRESVRSVLEIGSWEGRSTVFLAWLFPNAQITCIDTFAGGDEHAGDASLLSIEDRFRKNTERFADRLDIRKGQSASCLAALPADTSFDLIYIDGSHFYDDVIVDTILSWNRLKLDGFMIWDDYLWTMKKLYGKRLNPKPAIDQFLVAHRGEYNVLFSGWQVGIQKTTCVERMA